MTLLTTGLQKLNLPPNVELVLRFVIAGVLNTIVGATVTLTLDLGLHVKPALANAAGYAVGICVSWLLQRRFVFRTADTGWGMKAKYAATIALSFGLNQAVLAVMPHIVGVTPLARGFSQLVAMGTYTVVQFIIFRLWVFKSPASAPAASA